LSVIIPRGGRGGSGARDGGSGETQQTRSYTKANPGEVFSCHANMFECEYRNCHHIFPARPRPSGVKSAAESLVSLRREAGVTHNVFAPRSFRWRFFAWKIGPLWSLLVIASSPLRPVLPSDNKKAAAPGFSPATASVAWRCLEFWPTFFRTSSPTSPDPRQRTGVRARGMRGRCTCCLL
jgi:hypothetical protein